MLGWSSWGLSLSENNCEETECRIKCWRAECPFVCTCKFAGYERVYVNLDEIYVKADYFCGTLVKKREIPELPTPELPNSMDMGKFHGKVTVISRL